ncbi:MAG: hypothetical protein JWN66_3090, partial [Sphingomonas bacterium]|uniref:hypothetical protein n=1 Tax=Sphingomonas bacterium TaxID=1895847 RepID=UPI002629AE74
RRSGKAAGKTGTGETIARGMERRKSSSPPLVYGISQDPRRHITTPPAAPIALFLPPRPPWVTIAQRYCRQVALGPDWS